MSRLLTAIKNALINLYKALERFPVTIGYTTATTVMLIIISNQQPFLYVGKHDLMMQIAMVLALGAPVSLCIKLIFERKEANPAVRVFTYLLEGAVLIFYYFFLLDGFNMVPMSRYIALNIVFYLAFLFIPYLYKKENFELYVIKVFTNFFVAVIYSMVLFAGLAAILFTIDKLLSVPVASKTYYHIWLIVAGIFAPSLFLAEIPASYHQFETDEYPKLFKVLLLYIVMPVISVYTIILYIYFGKIIITQQWPVGLVSHLVLWYSVISAGVIFFISPVNNESRWAKGFIIWFPKLILPILVMMFISIGIRINVYGITENRYYVVALGLWALGVMIYFNLAKKRRNIILPVSISIIIILSVFGPLNSFSISKMSQNNRLENLLEKYDMVQENGIVKSNSEISKEDKIEMSQILYYFNKSHKLSDVRFLPEGFKLEDMRELFGFDYQSKYGHLGEMYFSYKIENVIKQIDVQGFDYFFDIRNYYGRMETTAGNNIEVEYNQQNNELRIIFEGDEIYKDSMYKLVKQLNDKYGTENKQVTDFDDMTFLEENDKLKLKIILNNVYGSKDISTGELKNISLEFYMFIKIK